jgi:SAM-dependent methyltransferase
MSAPDGDGEVNRRYWDGYADEYQAAHRERLAVGAAWGVWAIPDAEVGVVGAVDGLDVVELGCGSASWSVALAVRGARVVGVDVSPAQLGHARRAVAEAGVTDRVTLVRAPVEDLPLADRSADLLLSDHGALSYADPDLALPECARVLRPGGRLVFLTSSPWFEVCWDEEEGRVDDRLHLPYPWLGRVEASDGVRHYVEYRLSYGGWIRTLRAHGFTVEDLVELHPGPDATTTHDDRGDLDWARTWPAEHIWVARRAS